jgi:hypothetical protein
VIWKIVRILDCGLFGAREADLLFRRRVGVREGIESRMHLNMRPQIRHILGVCRME